MTNKYKRLALAKSEFPAIVKDTKAFGYNYAKLEQVLSSVEPALHKHDLDLLQTVIENKVCTYLVDLVAGEKELVGEITITPIQLAKMNEYQVMGSAISYFRRYQILACLGLAQEDDDAGGANQAPVVKNNPPPAKPKAPSSDDKAMIEQIKVILLKIGSDGIEADAGLIKARDMVYSENVDVSKLGNMLRYVDSKLV